MSDAMTLPTSNPFARWNLRTVLAVDAAAGFGLGALLLVASGPLATWLALPAELLSGAGLALMGFVVLLVVTAAMRRPAPALVWLVIAGNAAWVAASVLVAFALFDPSALGLAFVLAQALVVALLLVMEHRALARHGD